MMSMLTFYAEWMQDTYRFYNTVRELGSLSDEDLQSIGVSRSDIVMVASEQVVKKYDKL